MSAPMDERLDKELFPRTIVMDEGLIVMDGLTMEILEDEKLLEAHGLEKTRMGRGTIFFVVFYEKKYYNEFNEMGVTKIS